MGVVGESGCGKSVTSLVTIGLATCDVDDGSITFDGDELIQKTPQTTERTLSFLKYFSSFFTLGLILSLFWTFLEPIQGLQISAVMLTAFSICFVSTRILDAPRSKHEKFMRSIRGNKISMIFQEPMTALNPLYTVEKQVAEVLKQHNRLDEADANTAIKIGKAIISPAEMIVDFFRNDWKGALPIIISFLVILAIHQTDNADLILGLIVNKYVGIVFLALILHLIFSNIFTGNTEFTETTLIEPIGMEPVTIPSGIRLANNWVHSNFAFILVSWFVIIVLLWIPYGVLMTIILSVAILTIPPIQISNYFRLDSAHTRQVVKILKEVKIPNPESVVKMYPHELSGGMRQRVMIAMMMACEPKLLIADEPTTALDVTIQAQILKLMKDLRDREGTAIMMITHDLGVIAETCDTVTVMYAGRVVETASVTELFANPKHAYTRGLIACTPSLSSERKSILPAIPGQVANPSDFVEGCRFCQRMERTGETLLKIPDYKEISPGHWVEMCPICLDENEDKWE
tara:strand:+ start:5 stop:1555 length:1551 start_codon:yes stop_codon:yes gene_type:complete